MPMVQPGVGRLLVVEMMKFAVLFRLVRVPHLSRASCMLLPASLSLPIPLAARQAIS